MRRRPLNDNAAEDRVLVRVVARHLAGVGPICAVVAVDHVVAVQLERVRAEEADPQLVVRRHHDLDALGLAGELANRLERVLVDPRERRVDRDGVRLAVERPARVADAVGAVVGAPLELEERQVDPGLGRLEGVLQFVGGPRGRVAAE